MPTAIEQDIGRTLRLFSYFGYPLTSFEVWKWLYRPTSSYSFLEILNALESFSSHEGFYGMESEKFGDIAKQVRMRHRRFLNAVQKYKKLRWLERYLSMLPGVVGFAICNSLAIHHTREASDADIFVITRPGRIWSTRFFAVLPLILFRMRPKEAKRNPIDISFFVTEEALNVMRMKIGDEDPYLAWWVRSLVPMFGREEAFQLFVRHNAWAKMDFPNSLMPKRAGVVDRTRATGGRPPGTAPTSMIESFLKWLQEKKFPQDIRDTMNADQSVIVSDDVLKFHKNDRREEILRHLYAKDI